jgi:O-antigen/teichoic acid export membrane protein
MELLKRTGKNVFYKVLTDLLTKTANLIFILYLARTVGDVDFGKFSFAQSFAAVFLVVMELGLNQLLIREVAGRRELAREYLSHLMIIKGAVFFVLIGIIWFLIRIMGVSGEIAGLVLWLGLATLLAGFIEFFSAFFSAFELMGLETWLKGVHRGLMAVAGIGILALGYGLYGVVILLTAASFLSIFWGAFLVRKHITAWSWSFSLTRALEMLKEAFPLFAAHFFSFIYVRLDVILLFYLRGDHAEVGWYSAGIRILDAVSAIPVLVVGAVFPILSSLWARDRETLASFYALIFRLLWALAVPCLLGLYLTAPVLVPWLFGPSFGPAVYGTRVLVWSLGFIFVNLLLIYGLIVSGRARLNMILMIMLTAINLSLNLALIPRYGYQGACLVTLVTQGLLFLMTFFFINRTLTRLGADLFIRPIAAGAAGVMLWWVLGNAPLMIKVAGFILLYGILMALLGEVKRFRAIAGTWSKP